MKTALLDDKCTNDFINRDRIRIIASILIEAKKGLNKTQLIHCCNLNWRQMHAYLDFLLTKNLISKQVDSNGSEKFVTTPKGRLFLKEFRYLQALIE